MTAVELLPVHHSVAEQHLVERGLTNYWGYNSIGYLAPDSRFASTGARGEQVAEFKTMVKRLHQAGIEVILDVVYNHTAEGNHPGRRSASAASTTSRTTASRRPTAAATATTPAAATP